MDLSLAEERDRFVGFAFASADVLIEADDAGRVTYAAGALGRFGLPSQDQLVGCLLVDVLSQRDRPLLGHLLEAVRPGGRRGPVLMTSDGADAVGQWSLLRTPQQPRVFIAVRAVDGSRSPQSTAQLDAVTGLLDGAGFGGLAERELTRMLEGDQEVELSLVRLVGIEDAPGGIEGARVHAFLKRVAAALRGLSLNGDGAAHLGDGRFAILRARDAKAEQVPAVVAESLSAEGLSGIVADHHDVTLRDPSLSPRQACAALRHALRRFETSGEADFDHLADALGQKLADTAARVAQAKAVIDARDFYVLYQPIVGLADGQVHHNEALTRLTQNDVGIFDFVTFAEELGFISDFDIAIAREVLNKLAQLSRKRRLPHVAVNVSAVSLMNPGFIERLLKLSHAGGRADQVLFEVTESFQIVDLAAANAVIQQLRAAGHAVCLDDFGAGAAAFHYIQALRVDYVKLDGAFVQRVVDSDRDTAVLRGMVDLCRSLNVQTIAEMVETEEHASCLQALGVDLAQGHLFGKPAAEPLAGKAARCGRSTP